VLVPGLLPQLLPQLLGAGVRAVVHDVVQQRVPVGALHVLGGEAALRVAVRAPEVGPAIELQQLHTCQRRSICAVG
jgi:hypothetical protein